MSTVDEDIVLGKEGSLNMLAKSIRGKIYRSQIAMDGGVENADSPYQMRSVLPIKSEDNKSHRHIRNSSRLTKRSLFASGLP